ncbi:MAG: type II toxin-antitoxin system HicB family antitoxin [Colwellia sp.]|nr:type II toxin-antitoxin system HicB family antitoxin [Colwellia sp.]MCW9081584.1 type II toxin-antitoxin system HicB family antitoxin [Colwellia sp.]
MTSPMNMMEKLAMNYAIVFLDEKNDGLYQVQVPDLPGCAVSVNSIDMGLEKITKSIKSHLAILAEYGEKIPTAMSMEKHRHAYANDNPHTYTKAFWAIVNIDITAYLGKSHKINVTLPELLIKQIDDRVSKSSSYRTRSGFIASACLAELEK